MDCDQEGMTSDSSLDDNESDLEIDASDTIIKSDNEEDDEEELEWNRSQDFVPDATFSFNEIEGHSTITSGNNIQQKSFAKSIVHTYACCWN